MSERELAGTLSESSAALARMRSIAETNWEAQHGHEAPCPPDCPIMLEADRKVQEIWGKIQPDPHQDPYLTEVLPELFRTHGDH